jgi:tRNA threonylcarbamoyladenosine biosynthesis protein TsaB
MTRAILGFDTATPSTAAAVLLADGRTIEARDDPGAGERPAHASRLLSLLEAVLEEARIGWPQVGRLAVGIGPGGFTGLRIGIATARALAQARDLEVVPVGSLHALAAGAPEEDVAAVLDARRGQVFAAIWRAGVLELEPSALDPEVLAARVGPGILAVGNGAVRFRDLLEGAGASVPAADSPAHRLLAAHVCRLGAAGEPADRDALLPDYRREPDAKPQAQ